MEKETRTRFAPSPTGFMHVGNLRTALYSYLLAKSQGGKFILRIEDTDRERYVDGAVDVIYKTLAAAGLQHDEGPDKDGGRGPYVQSLRKDIYLPYAEELVKNGAAYYCFCDKTEESEDGEETPGKTGYDGRCRKLDAETVKASLAAGKPYVIRQKINHEGSTAFTDSVFGEISIENKVLDDQILIKRDGMPTYNFANVIDDHLMGITHVVRGCEYLSSTPKYNLLYQAFGWEIPTYVHLPLIMGKDAEGNVSKLSKRHGSVSFEALVKEGYLPEAIINYVALLGWSSKTDRELFTLKELEEVFSVRGLNKSAAVFDYGKLAWMNSEYLKKLSPGQFAAAALPFAGIAGSALETSWPDIAALMQQRIEKLTDIPDKTAFLHRAAEYNAGLFNNKKSKADPEKCREALKELIPQIAVCDWNKDSLNALFNAYAEKHGVKLGLPMWAVRIALSGLSVTPGGPTEIMLIIGREEALRRLQAGLEK